MQALLDTNVDTLMVLDDDAVLSCHFQTELLALLRETRCGGILSSTLVNAV